MHDGQFEKGDIVRWDRRRYPSPALVGLSEQDGQVVGVSRNGMLPPVFAVVFPETIDDPMEATADELELVESARD